MVVHFDATPAMSPGLWFILTFTTLSLAGCTGSFDQSVSVSTAFVQPAYDPPYLGFRQGDPAPGGQLLVLVLDYDIYHEDIIVDLADESSTPHPNKEPRGDLGREDLESPTQADGSAVLRIPPGEDYVHFRVTLDQQGEATLRVAGSDKVILSLQLESGSPAGTYGQCERQYRAGDLPVRISVPASSGATVPFAAGCNEQSYVDGR